MSDQLKTPWLTVRRGAAPLLLCMPHTGTDIPPALASDFVSPWLARRDTDWWIERLYGFAAELGASLVHTAVSRSVIDMNRDPSGASLYPGQATTELCPTHHLRRGAALPRRARAGGGGDRRAPRRVFSSPTIGPSKRNCAACRAAIR